MAKSRRKKIALLTILSSFVVAAGALVVTLGTKEGKMFRSSAGTEIPGTLNYSYTSSGHKTISSLKHSFKKTTSSGTDIYFYSENNNGIGTSLIATFGSSNYSSSYFSFTKDENGAEPFIFQNVTSLKIRTGSQSTAGAGFKIFTSQSAATASYEGTIGVSEEKTISEIAGATYIKVVPTSSSWLDIESVQLNYSCDPEASGKTLVGLHFSGTKKTTYAVNAEFVAPTVYGDYVDGEKVLEPEVVDAEFSGYDMSQLGVQTVTASFGGKSIQYDIHVKPTENSIYLNYLGARSDGEATTLEGVDFENSSLPSYAEFNETVNFNVVMKSGYSFMYFIPDMSIDSIWEQIDDPSEPSQSIQMPPSGYSEISVQLQYAAPIVSIELEDNPKTVYYTGSSFVEPKVYSIESNGSKVQLTSGVTFSGFDSSQVADDLEITVTYSTLPSIVYTIDVLDASEQITISGVYQTPQSSNTMSLEFNSNGSGQYVYINAYGTRKFIINFTYEVDSSRNVTITLDSNTSKSNITGYTNGYKIVNANASTEEWVNSTGHISESETEFTIRMWRVSVGVYSQDETPLVFSVPEE